MIWRNEVRALLLDPGESTGMALARWSDDQGFQLIYSKTIPGGALGFIDWVKYDFNEFNADLCVCEDFKIDGTITGTWSPQIEGALMALWPRPIVWQGRDEKGSLLPGEPERNEWLKSRGFDLRTQHERDAVVHGIVYTAKRLHHLPTIEKFWPKPEN